MIIFVYSQWGTFLFTDEEWNTSIADAENKTSLTEKAI